MEIDQLFKELLASIVTPQQDIVTAGDLYRLRNSMESPPPATQPRIEYDVYNNRYIGHLGSICCNYQLLGTEDAAERDNIRRTMRESLIRAQARPASDAMRQDMNAQRIELQALQNQMSAAETFAEHQELSARHNTVRELLRQAEDEYMTTGTWTATATTTTTNWTSAPTIKYFEPHIPNSEDPVLMFTMKQNTHAVELRKLRANYSDAVFRYDFNIPLWRQFDHYKTNVRGYLSSVRRQLTAKKAYMNEIKPRNREILLDIFTPYMSSREIDFIMNENTLIAPTHAYLEFVDSYEAYRTIRQEFKRYQARYSEQQADHNRRAAMIRQKPELHITINRQAIVNTLMSWDNVWAADTYVDRKSATLYIRIGLCDIVMSESAQESYYREPQDIMLAPFFVTLKISATGNVIVSSRESQIRGLSRGHPGQLNYDVHPHQLSDAPCFGTFGQALIDLGNNGDFISYIGTLIAFYSQYNSQDSAGVTARRYHPSNLCLWGDEGEYKFRLCDGMRSYGKHLELDEIQLDAAMERYKEYHQENNGRSPPEVMQNEVCASCENEPINDDNIYFNTAYNSRVCEDCWVNHYCSECERADNDCACEPSEE